MNLAELLSARVPRYTSYPTTPHFNAQVTAGTYRSWLQQLPEREPLSLYIHIPFCDSLCWFCGCHTGVVNAYGPVAAYVDVLLREVEIVAEMLGARRTVTHVHFGGGSPTILKPSDIRLIVDRLRARFDVAATAEFAMEVDPRGLGQPTIDALARVGVTRVSIGVQDVNPRVQLAVNRWQPLSVTRNAVVRLRQAGIAALNIDVMYGLPHQGLVEVGRTIEEVVALAPQRVAVFGYAHVPDMKRHQRLIDPTALPDGATRLAQYEAAHAALVACGYQAIGLDHFARPDDPLSVALRGGRLRRNFQGYTDDGAGALVGIGASAISSLPQGYAQNASSVRDYRALILRGGPATTRGTSLTSDDRLRRTVIERLMCNLEADVDDIARARGAAAGALATELRRLAPLEASGVVEVRGTTVRVPDHARVALRVVASMFDAHLSGGPVRHSVAV